MVLVTHDLLGLFDRFTPRFVKQYAQLHIEMQRAFTAYREEVAAGVFPAAEHAVSMPEDAWREFLSQVGDPAAGAQVDQDG